MCDLKRRYLIKLVKWNMLTLVSVNILLFYKYKTSWQKNQFPIYLGYVNKS